jgi:sphingomyelin phosphodiesterase
MKYGYYAVQTRHDSSLVIIALNTNLCYIQNFWLPYNPIDPSHQLQWLADTLQEVENKGQTALLLGHIYPGSGECWYVWSAQFERIVQRYSEMGTIGGQFYGHSHEQGYRVTIKEGTGATNPIPISVAISGGSGVTDGMNPGYNLYHTETTDHFKITSHETWVLNLTASSHGNVENPIFTKILNSKNLFGLESLEPKEIYGFIQKMICDHDVFIEYQK